MNFSASSATPPRISFGTGRLLPSISQAFQPIVDARSETVVSYEALVRGPQGEPAKYVFDSVPPALLPAFDEHCRSTALRTASRLGLDTHLHLNLLPQTVLLGSDALASTRRTAQERGISLDCLVIEITEQEVLGDSESFRQLCDFYRGSGMRIAFDDFGIGYSGLNLLAEFQPDALKLDRSFARGITRLGPRQAIVRGIIQVCRDLGIEMIAEGIETRDEYRWFCDEGVYLFQGYLFARPAFEALPIPVFPH